MLREFVNDFPGARWTWEQDHVYAGGMLVGGEVQEWGYTETYRYGGRRHYHLDHLGSVRMVRSDTRFRVGAPPLHPKG